ncbi:Ornithine carbamoyltransferase [Candidatus Terasakiella magnetica]|uniref:Ornithine carbamoyltransferase n=1 Tax=Candidatus Terasakiella magnetica TaxID=1867952 RepID=A0A1C3RM01_9PROT|nr:ornithine carbamoyltransferase [Candidatus Terasakiella magnetica]SCA58320.1 Ornithine carbamoyltransferase [Candidatus Terasakiella magnetica]
MTPKHFLDLALLESSELRHILDIASGYKKGMNVAGGLAPLAGKTLAMIFEKPSTRTRVSFEVGMVQLGGHPLVMMGENSQLGRGETVADTARVLSRMVDGVMLRTDSHDKLLEMAEYCTVPVINALTDDSHPCQLMADIMTIEEHRGPIGGKVVTWVGDGNNMTNSYIEAATRFGFELRLCCPEELMVDQRYLDWAANEGGNISVVKDPKQAASGSDVIVTDTWVSMGDTDYDRRIELLTPYQVNSDLMGQAASDALFLHCLPAHRNEEVTDEVIDGANSVVWDEAENRLHAQKGIMVWSML